MDLGKRVRISFTFAHIPTSLLSFHFINTYTRSKQVERVANAPRLDWDLEIRKRYTSALSSETHEFPTPTSISHRLLPTCYEFGLPQGHSAECAEYLNIATETYIKEALMSLLGKICVNGAGFVRTGQFKKRVSREERQAERGEIMRIGGMKELPVEAEERRKRKMLCMEDLKLALTLGDGYLGQSPVIAGGIMHSRCLDTQGIEGLYDEVDGRVKMNGSANGTKGKVGGENWNVDFAGDVQMMDVDVNGNDAEGWIGGEAEGLDGVLDDVLSLGDL